MSETSSRVIGGLMILLGIALLVVLSTRAPTHRSHAICVSADATE